MSSKKVLEEKIKHEKELREAKEDAVEKERQIQFNEYERRLTTLNHAHEQALEAQAKTVPREVFDNYVKESDSRVQLALKSVTEKYDTLIAAKTETHQTDVKIINEQIATEREIRKENQGSIATWKWLIGFLGVSGVGGVILLFLTRASN